MNQATTILTRAGDHTAQAAAPRQMGKERIEFALHSAAHAGEEKSDQMGEGQLAFAREIPRFLPSRLEKGRASNEVSQPGKYVDIFRPSYLTYKYQSVKNRNHIRNGPSLAIASKYAEVLSHEDWDRPPPREARSAAPRATA